MNNTIIRSEHRNDFQDIAAVHAVTFIYSFGMGEVSLVSVLRNRKTFDPELSLVAEQDGKVIGHMLFTPQQMYVKGMILKGLILGPIAVYTEFQNQGVGSQLIEEGHKRAKQKGYHLSLLIGHPTYYPRFGYHANMWGQAQINIQLKDIPSPLRLVEERRIELSDMEAFIEMWEYWYKDAELAIRPSTSITDWISPGSGIQASAVIIDQQLAGYMRYDKNNPLRIISILARNAEALTDLCGYLKGKVANKEFLSLPIPPQSPGLERFNLAFTSEMFTGPEKMVKQLDEQNKSVTDYLDQVKEGKSSPGLFIWPVEFDVC
ncbi:hypothetical protein Back11_58480 [Paenibacillus baekrokdamisoli]|uniref:Uncharacterized protein n=1 Tax=Paenibacillus baekrokdamisoli TaxID=1712516 RepID=A0A3G9JHQ1_9BACL|nr:N-acetyltransferase [Paenibacillus baekrokdamisoli]MBB3071466.1 putative N-acetyltransferase YhbS [Paenibacillus baekrokdamisoli]BBH24503.1 hypothetical protein Back11_58480 [Paenibacillus baekrokdamisoli]